MAEKAVELLYFWITNKRNGILLQKYPPIRAPQVAVPLPLGLELLRRSRWLTIKRETGGEQMFYTMEQDLISPNIENDVHIALNNFQLCA